MTEKTSEFLNQIRHQILKEKKIISSFEADSESNIISALTDTLRESSNKYTKIIEIVEAASLESDEVNSKWQKIQKRLNEEVFGIVDWSVLLDELKEAKTNQDQLLNETTGERARIREKIPTSFVRSSPPDVAPSPFPIIGLDDMTDIVDGEEEQALELAVLAPPTPQPKEELVSQIEQLATSKRKELDSIHAQQLGIIEAHREKLIRESKERCQERIDKLEGRKEGLLDLIDLSEQDDFNMQLRRETEEKIDNEIMRLSVNLDLKIESIQKKSAEEIEKAKDRCKRIGEKFESQIQTAHSTYKVIEDSGLFSLKEMMALKPEEDVEKASALSFIAAAKEQISGGQTTNEALKKLRDKSALLMAQNQDEEVQKGVISVLSSLVFSSLEGKSKGKIISILVQALNRESAVLPAEALSDLARDTRFVFRLSEKDADIVVKLVNRDATEVRRAAILLVSNQLFLERNGVIPKLSKQMSREMQNELIDAFAEDKAAPIIKELTALGYIKTSSK